MQLNKPALPSAFFVYFFSYSRQLPGAKPAKAPFPGLLKRRADMPCWWMENL